MNVVIFIKLYDINIWILLSGWIRNNPVFFLMNTFFYLIQSFKRIIIIWLFLFNRYNLSKKSELFIVLMLLQSFYLILIVLFLLLFQGYFVVMWRLPLWPLMLMIMLMIFHYYSWVLLQISGRLLSFLGTFMRLVELLLLILYSF